jgi:hypothetical protein
MMSSTLRGTTNQNDPMDILASRILLDSEKSGDILNARCYCQLPLSPTFICTECVTPLCRDCAKAIGSSDAAICQSCGSLCLPLARVRARVVLLADRRSNFGFADLRLALRYPLPEAVTCLGLGVIYGASLFSLPFFNIGYAGILLGSLGLIPAFVGNSMMFGCALRIVEQVHAGRMDCAEAFDVTPLLADVWDTAKLGIAILLSLGWLYVVGSRVGLSPATSVELTTIWMVFTYPAVLSVAAINRGFWSTINPALLLSTIMRMRGNYWRLLAMCLSIMLAIGASIALIALTLLPAEVSLPIYLTLGVVVGPPIFYANMVIACLVGRALFKCSDRF